MRNELNILDYRPIDDFRDAGLGDKRLDERLARSMELLAEHPGVAPAEALAQDADRGGYYRLLHNDRCTDDKLWQVHREQSVARCKAANRVLVLHDTSQMKFRLRDVQREGLGVFGADSQGYWWHASLACTFDPDSPIPLGVVNSHPYVQQSELYEECAEAFWNGREDALECKTDRWAMAIEQVDERLQDVAQVVHVADREADIYTLLALLVVLGTDGVIRLSHDRRVEDETASCIGQCIERQPCLDRRQVTLSPRQPSESSKQHPARIGRTATVELRAMTLTIRRPEALEEADAPATLKMQVVEVREIDPPKDEEAMVWRLVTTLPVDDVAAAWEVVDIYRCRWLIEEFFKAVKTGAGYRKLQNRTVETLLLVLPIYAVLGLQILVLRSLDRHFAEEPGARVFRPLQIAILRAKRPKLVPESDPTIGDVTAAIASLGGHNRSNGSPGWQVLGRGYRKLLELEEGVRLAQQLDFSGDLEM